jgi:hypothetical protein
MLILTKSILYDRAYFSALCYELLLRDGSTTVGDRLQLEKWSRKKILTSQYGGSSRAVTFSFPFVPFFFFSWAEKKKKLDRL